MNWRDVDLSKRAHPVVTHDPANPPEDERVRCEHGVILEDSVCFKCEPDFPARRETDV